MVDYLISSSSYRHFEKSVNNGSWSLQAAYSWHFLQSTHFYVLLVKDIPSLKDGAGGSEGKGDFDKDNDG